MAAVSQSPVWALTILVIAVFGSIVCVLLQMRLRVRYRLERLCIYEMARFEQVIRCTEPCSSLLLADMESPVGGGLQLFRTTPLIGVSKQAHQNAIGVCAQWLVWRYLAVEILAHATKLYATHSRQRWWQLRYSVLRQAIDSLTRTKYTADPRTLPEKLRRLAGIEAGSSSGLQASALLDVLSVGSVTTLAAYNSFQTMLRTASESIRDIELEFCGRQKDDGIDHLRRCLVSAGLPLAPYSRMMGKVAILKDKFCALLSADPMSDCRDILEKALRRKIKVLKHCMVRALASRSALTNLQRESRLLANGLDELRSTRLNSAVPEVSFEVGYRFSESGFDPSPSLSRCQRLLTDFHDALQKGGFLRCNLIQTAVKDALQEAQSKLRQQISDREAVEAILATIAADSSQSDIESDAESRSQIVALYAEQQWHGAHARVKDLEAKHALRRAVRSTVCELRRRFDSIGQEVETLQHVVSEALTCELQFYASEVTKMCARAQSGYCDWDMLKADAMTLSNRLFGAEMHSFSGRLRAELAAYNESATEIACLQVELTAIQAKVEHCWGGRDASISWQSVNDLAQILLADSSISKADWPRLLARAQNLRAKLVPVSQLIESEIARFHQVKAKHDELERLLAVMRQRRYTMTAGGTLFGTGIYFAGPNLDAQLNNINQLLAQRRFDDCALLVQDLVTKMNDEHLECYWLLLQTMWHSDIPAARSFAAAQDYFDGGFVRWSRQRLGLEDSVYPLAQATENGVCGLPYSGKSKGVMPPPATDYLL